MTKLDELTARRWAKTLYQRVTSSTSYVPTPDEVAAIIAAHEAHGWGEKELSHIAGSMMEHTNPAQQFRIYIASVGKRRKPPTQVAPLRKIPPKTPLPAEIFNDPPPDTVSTLPPKTPQQDEWTKAGLDAARRSLEQARAKAKN